MKQNSIKIRKYKSKLFNDRIIQCINDNDNSRWRIPSPYLFSAIPLLWSFLEETVNDWIKKRTPYQKKLDNSSSSNEEIILISQALYEVSPYFLKCLFSYILFFDALEKAYKVFLKELNEINKNPCFRLKHSKSPKKNPFLEEKIKIIRDISIVHLGDPNGTKTKKFGKATVWSACNWGHVMVKKEINSSFDLDRILFKGSMTIFRNKNGDIVEKSKDLAIEGISELHTNCSKYLIEFDNVCETYFNKILSVLPKKDSNVQYTKLNLQATESVKHRNGAASQQAV